MILLAVAIYSIIIIFNSSNLEIGLFLPFASLLAGVILSSSILNNVVLEKIRADFFIKALLPIALVLFFNFDKFNIFDQKIGFSIENIVVALNNSFFYAGALTFTLLTALLIFEIPLRWWMGKDLSAKEFLAFRIPITLSIIFLSFSLIVDFTVANLF